MKSYRIEGESRVRGAIGKFYHKVLFENADNEQDLMKKLYMEWDFFMYPQITERVLFTNFPEFSKYDVMTETKFWSWLKENYTKYFIEDLKGYLYQYGFDINIHILSEEQITIFKAIDNHFYYCKYHKIGDFA